VLNRRSRENSYRSAFTSHETENARHERSVFVDQNESHYNHRRMFFHDLYIEKKKSIVLNDSIETY